MLFKRWHELPVWINWDINWEELFFEALKFVQPVSWPLGKYFAAIFTGQMFRASMPVVHMFSTMMLMFAHITTKLARPPSHFLTKFLIEYCTTSHEG